jgi:hypothetical protein
MNQKSKKHISPWIAWAVVALMAGIAGFCIWYYFDQVTTAYENSFITSSKKSPTKKTTTTATDTADWKTYENKKVGFEFQYPGNLEIYPQDPKGTPNEFISVSAEKLTEIGDQPSGWGQETALKDKAALEKGDASTRVGWSMGATKLNLDGAIGKMQFVPAEFDVSVNQIIMQSIIYKNDYRIVIDLVYNDQKNLVKNNSQYFTSEPTIGTVWKDGGMDTFYTDLQSGKTDISTQNWYKLFSQIIKTFN